MWEMILHRINEPRRGTMRHLIGASLAVFVLCQLAGCAAGGNPPQPSAAQTLRYVEFRRVAYQEEPGYTMVRPPWMDERIYVAPEAIVNEKDIASTTTVDMKEQFGVGVEFTRGGARRLARFTGDNVGGYMALILDGRVIQVLPILEPVREGRLLLAGGFNKEQATKLAADIDARR
jgi:preprotein translocase subunit SecD